MIRLPQLQTIALRGFTLYRNKPAIEAVFGSGVFCLAGANGLGKSTFLAALSFGLTGIAADPGRSFRSVDEYYRHSISYSEDHFSGRIRERDRDGAEISISMELAGHTYNLTRNMFEPQELRALSIVDSGNQSVVKVADEPSPGDLHRLYADAIIEDSGLSSFEQFAFLQHFVFTFDERRHLLFWDQRVASQALFLAFGLDPERVREADKLERAVERNASQARNLQYQATTARQRMEDLHKRVESAEDDDPDVDLVAEFDSLTAASRSAIDREARLRAALGDAQTELASKVAEQIAARSDYERAFESRLQGSGLAAHPVVRQIIESGTCEVCGGSGSSLADHISDQIRQGSCPLCGSPAEPERNPDESAKQLREADERLDERIAEVEEAASAVSRLESDLEAAISEMDQATAALDRFEKAHVDDLPDEDLDQDKPALLRLAAQYKAEMDDALQRKKEFIKKRNDARKRLESIRSEFTAAYSAGREDFVPLFTDLAGEFLGLDLDLALDTSGAGGAQLVLTLDGSKRRGIDQLSESQRYFVDIALRMALAQYMSASEHPATLFIDTPEGSLDIAYERRAGLMFGQFVADGYHIVMTANINTSQLLLNLAATCGSERMRLLRMTDWTALSDVQADAEALFDTAYSEIEAALIGGGGV